jgi:poly(3-hydroxybutyrate) depolymerase
LHRAEQTVYIIAPALGVPKGVRRPGRERDTGGRASMARIVERRVLFLRRSGGSLGFRVPAGLMAAAFSALFGCTSACKPALAPGQVSRTVTSPTEELLFVNGGGRTVRSIVLLPDDYAAHPAYPVLFAVHNFAGNAQGFAELIHAERLREQGMVIVLPEAAGWIPQWQGPGITITVPTWQPATNLRVDDVSGLAQTLRVALATYRIKPDDVNIVGFSQGATVALELTRRLDEVRPASVRRVFAVAGSLAETGDTGLSFEGTDLIAYEPGRNGPQDIANFLTGEPSEHEFIPEILRAKNCRLESSGASDHVERQIYRCHDGRRVVHIREPDGEHAWPGQAPKFDSRLMGRGSISRVDFTSIIAQEIGGVLARSRSR